MGLRVNLHGTRNVVRFLAECPRLDRLHYVSTCYVSGTTTGVFHETDLDVGQSFKNHYEETKFLAEMEVARSGLPVTTYRPSIVVGDSRTGETGKFDGPYFTLTAMEKIPSPGVFIKIGSGLNPANVVPVDFVTEAMARLSVSPGLARADVPPGRSVIRCPCSRSASSSRASCTSASSICACRRGSRRRCWPPGPSSGISGCRWRRSTTSTTRAVTTPRRRRATSASWACVCPPLPSYVGRLVEFYRAHRDGVRRSAMV